MEINITQTQGVFMIVLGVALIVVCAAVMLRKKRMIRNGAHAKAVVVRTEQRRRRGRQRAPNNPSPFLYHPVFRFSTPDGEREIEYGVGHNEPRFDDSEVVDIVYNPAKPQELYIPGDKTPMIATLIISIFGIALISLGVFGIVIY